MPGSEMETDPLLTDVPVCEGYKTLGGVVLYEKLGQGGMGAVYKGRHLRLDVDVAVKVMAPPTGMGHTAADNFIQRFVREAKTAASVKHQNLIRVMDVNTESGVYYLVMDYVDGESAADRLKRKGSLTEGEALEICLGAAEGLGQAHSKGIVHRDVKPDNIMVDKDGCVVVADLGLAKAYGVDQADVTMGLSMSQQAMGTPYYMSPEQTRSARDVSPSADVWSLGVSFYQLLAGKVPWPNADLAELIMKIRNEPVPDIRQSAQGLAEATYAIVEKAMQKDPALRYADCREMAAALRADLGSVKSSPESVLPDSDAGTTKMALAAVTPPPQRTLSLIGATMLGGAPGLAKAGGVAAVPVKVRGRVSLGRAPGQAQAAADQMAVTPPTIAPRAVSARTWAVMLAVGALILLAGVGIAALVYGRYAALERRAGEERAAWRVARAEAEAKAAAHEYDAALRAVDEFLAAVRLDELKQEAGRYREEIERRRKDFERGEALAAEDEKAWNAARAAAESKAAEEDYRAAIADVDSFLAKAATDRFKPAAEELKRDLVRRKAEREARIRDEERKRDEARRAAKARIKQLLAAAQALREKGLLEKARDEVSEVLAADPDHPEAMRLLSQIQNDIAARGAEAERAATYKKWMDEGFRLRLGGKLLEAATTYDHAKPHAPAGTEDAATAAAVCRHDHFKASARQSEKDGDLAAAVGSYEKALTFKDDPETRRALERAKKVLKAERDRLSAQERCRSEAEEAEAGGDLKTALERYREAAAQGAAVADKIAYLEGELSYREKLDSARAHFAEGNWREATEVAEAILESEPAREEASSLLTEIRTEHGPWGPVLTIDLGSGVKVELAYVKPGTFKMGSETGSAAEKPVREVTITKGFYIGRYEVTQTQYYVLTRLDPSFLKGTDLPVEKASWLDAVRYCQALSRFAGKTARLPTEAEWEYACRAGSEGNWCFGGEKDGRLADYAWYGGFTRFAKTHPVGRKKPNAWGLHDMHGNVWEWCSDWHSPTYYQKSPSEDPTGPATGKLRVLRGGSFSDRASRCRSAARDAKKPAYKKLYVGFRVIVEAGAP